MLRKSIMIISNQSYLREEGVQDIILNPGSRIRVLMLSFGHISCDQRPNKTVGLFKDRSFLSTDRSFLPLKRLNFLSSKQRFDSVKSLDSDVCCDVANFFFFGFVF